MSFRTWHRAASGFGLIALGISSQALASLTLLPVGPQIGNNAVNNLVTNGSFEIGAPAPDGPAKFWATGTAITPFAVPGGWTSSGAAQTYASWQSTTAGANYRTRGSDFLPDGQSSLYFGNLTTSINQQPSWNPNRTVTFSSPPTFTPTFGQPCTLSQTVATNASPAPSYILSFWASGEDSGTAGSLPDGIFGLQVTNTVPGDPIRYLTVPSGSSSLGASTRYEFSFTPLNPAAPVTITFLNWGHVNQYTNSAGQNVSLFTTELVIDDVIVNPVPTPGAASVLAVAGLVAGRRRRA